jgi:hypothetical protein
MLSMALLSGSIQEVPLYLFISKDGEFQQPEPYVGLLSMFRGR